MKQLIAGIVFLLVVGVGAFVYRNALEHPAGPLASSTSPAACTTDAKICPDGTSVGRTAPNCAFATCAYPNVEFPDVQLAFAVPAGYAESKNYMDSPEIVMVYDKPAGGEGSHTIGINRILIPTGKSANQILLEWTILNPSGMHPKAMNEFKPKIISGRTFSCITTERFEGQVSTACYLIRSADILRFTVREENVDWTNPKLVIDDLPEHKAFYSMLATLQTP
jgi:hypothetical protein